MLDVLIWTCFAIGIFGAFTFVFLVLLLLYLGVRETWWLLEERVEKRRERVRKPDGGTSEPRTQM